MISLRCPPTIECPGCGATLELIKSTYKNSHYECVNESCEVMDVWYHPLHKTFKVTRCAVPDPNGSQAQVMQVIPCPYCGSDKNVVSKGSGMRRTERYYCFSCCKHFNKGTRVPEGQMMTHARQRVRKKKV